MCECKVLVGFCFYDVMLSRRQTLIKSSRAMSRVRCILEALVGDGTEMVPEVSKTFN